MRIPQALYDRQGYYALLRYSTPIKLVNSVLAEIQRVLRQPYLYAYPCKIIVDTENVCNLRCLYCPTGQEVDGRAKGFMSFERFKSIVDRIGKYVYIVDLFDWGEPLLNKDIYAIIRYAEQKHLCTNIHTDLNSKLSEENVEQIVFSGLSYRSIVERVIWNWLWRMRGGSSRSRKKLGARSLT